MKRTGCFFLLFALLAMCFTGCTGPGEKDLLKRAEKELRVDLSSGTAVTVNDGHGGFHGDGVSSVVIQFGDEAFARSIEGGEGWLPLPFGETVQALAYGYEFEDGKYGPFLTDEEGRALLPEIENGCYWLRDRQAEDDRAPDVDMIQRASLNFTLAVYDTDNRMLYYYEMDT